MGSIKFLDELLYSKYQSRELITHATLDQLHRYYYWNELIMPILLYIITFQLIWHLSWIFNCSLLFILHFHYLICHHIKYFGALCLIFLCLLNLSYSIYILGLWKLIIYTLTGIIVQRPFRLKWVEVPRMMGIGKARPLTLQVLQRPSKLLRRHVSLQMLHVPRYVTLVQLFALVNKLGSLVLC